MRQRIAIAYFRDDRVGPYLDALRAAGAESSDLLPISPRRLGKGAAREAMAEVAGLLLTGGADIQPCLYGEARLPEAEVDPPQAGRDQLEWDLLEEAERERLPVFGICRGHQFVHVHRGGALYQDVALQVAGSQAHRFYLDDGFAADLLAHEVAVAEVDHPFAAALRRHAPVAVNSRHHEAVKRLGRDLVTIATAPDGVVEASALASDDWWLRTVQWHPENLVDFAVHLALFRDFLAAARERAEREPVAAAGR